MEKDTYVLSFMGRSTIGKSRIISSCIEDTEIASYMHQDNVSGKTKTNIVYTITSNGGNSFKLIPKTNDIYKQFLTQTTDTIQFKVKEFKAAFSEISEEDFDGIERFLKQVVDMDELMVWLNNYFKKIEKRILGQVLLKEPKAINKQILICSQIFEDHLDYNKLFNIEIELQASEKFKLVLEKYGLDHIILIDSRGVFDTPDQLQRSFTRYTPDVNIFIFDDKGMTKHLFNEIYKELEPMFGQSFEVCIRTASPLTAQALTIDNCINPTKNKSLAKKFKSSIEFLTNKNALDGNTVFDIRLREQLGSILPEIPDKDDNQLTQEQIEDYNAKYDDIVFGIFNKVLGLKQQEEKAIATVRKKCKNPIYKEHLIKSIVYGDQYSLWEKYAKRCLDAVNGDGKHLEPKPQSATLISHIENLFFRNYSTVWGREQYICNIVTYEGANLIKDAITQIRGNKDKFSDEELSEYLFILKNTLSECQKSLSHWKSYVFFSKEGYRKSRIPSQYYDQACKDTVAFSTQGTMYYTIYDKLEEVSQTKCHKSALLHCIVQAVSQLLQEKLKIEKIILDDTQTAKQKNHI